MLEPGNRLAAASIISVLLCLPGRVDAEGVLVEFTAADGSSLVARGDPKTAPGAWSDEAVRKAVEARATAIADARDDLVGSLSPMLAGKVLSVYENFPLLGMDVDEADLLELMSHPMVVAVHEDTQREAFTSSSLPYIDAPYWHEEGDTGEGTAVAVLDTGIQYWNGFFGDCEPVGGPGCRVKVFLGFAHLAWGTGETDPAYVAEAEPHGSNVGGIVGDTAPGTDLLSLGVFAYYNPDSSTGFRGGALANDSDVASALDWCITNRATYNIVAANMSLGSSVDPTATGFCSGWMAGAYQAAFANARAAGVMPVVAAGNDYVKTAIGPPSCLASAMSVAAGYDDPAYGYSCGTGPVVPGAVTCFSNSNTLVTLVAPGNDVDAGGFYHYSGTSMASPHAAGVVALYASRYGTDPLWTMERMRVDASTVLEEGPRQTYVHRYVRVGDRNALLGFDAGAVLESDFIGIPIPDNDTAGLSVSTLVACMADDCPSDAAGSIYLDLTIDHARIPDLGLELEDPDGNVAVVDIEEGGELGVENVNSILGSQHLVHAFDDLKGGSIEGTWTLRVIDATDGEHGYLVKAVLLIDSARVELDAAIEAPDVARPGEPFDVTVELDNEGNLDVTGAPLTLELVSDETGSVVDSADLEIELPVQPGEVTEASARLSGDQGSFAVRVTTAGLEPDLPPGLHSTPVPVSITYRTFASFEVDPFVPEPDEEARMVVLSRGIIDSYLWDFGDGMTSTLPEPTHSWAESGTYDVTLTVTGPDGSSTTVRSVEVEAGSPPGFLGEGGGCACAVSGPPRAAVALPLLALVIIGLAVRLPRRKALTALAAAALGLSGCQRSHQVEDASTDTSTDGTGAGPWISLLDPADPSEGDIDLWVMLSSLDSADCDVTVDYRIGEAEYAPATLEDPAEAIGLASSPDGEEHAITWRSTLDVPGDVDDLRIRVQATCGSSETLPVESGPFTLQNFLIAHPHAVLVTEVSCAEANIPADYQADYVEITNTTDEDISLDGWTLSVWGSGMTSQAYALDGLTLPAGERLSFTYADAGIPSGIEIDDNQFPWSIDTGGAVAVIASRGRGIDFVRWGGSPALPPEDLSWTDDPTLPIPQTLTVLNRMDETTDSDRAGDFCLARPTPGQDTRGCFTRLSPGDVLLTEMDTQGTDDMIELLNRTTEEVNLAGWLLLWDGGESLGSGKFPLAEYGLDPGRRIVLRDNGTKGRIYTTGTVLMELGENLNLDALFPIALGMQDPYGQVIDFLAAGGSRIRWMEWIGDEPTPMPGPSTTLSRIPGDPDTDSASDFCLTEMNLGGPATTCLAPIGIQLRLTEVMPGRPDWVEIMNPGSTTVDLSQVYLSYSSPYYGGSVGDFQLGGSLDPGALLVLAERDLSFMTGEYIIDGNMSIAPEGDAAISLRDIHGFGIDFVKWGEPLGMPLWPDTWPGLGQDTHAENDWISLQRFPHDGTDTDSRDDWCWAEPSPDAAANPCE